MSSFHPTASRRYVRWVLLALLLALLPVAPAPFRLQRVEAAEVSFLIDDHRLFGSGNDNTQSVAFGDVNADGNLDLIVGNIGQNAIYLNNGSGNFDKSLPHLFGTGSDSTHSVAVGDMNGDGALDIVVGNGGDGNTLTGKQNVVYLNDGVGNFYSGPVICGVTNPARVRCFGPGTHYTYTVAVGDVNGDGKLDIVAGKAGLNGGLDGVYLNDGTGHFPQDSGLPIGNQSAQTFRMAIGDLNGDGYLDLVAGNGGQDEVYLNNGSGNFLAANAHPFGTGSDNTLSVVLGDMDGDGKLDIIVGNYSANGLQNAVYLNDGQGNFPIANRRVFGANTDTTYSVAVADFNGDGYLDIVVGNYTAGGNTGQSAIYLNDGVGHFPESYPLGPTGAATVYVGVGDVDGNGRLDIVVGNNSEQSMVYLNNGAGNIAQSRMFGTALDNTDNVTMADMNSDGHLDLVVGNNQQQSVVYLNDGTGNFTTRRLFGTGSDAIDNSSIRVGDMDGDGSLDIIVGGFGQQSAVYLNDGQGNFPFINRRLFGTGLEHTRSVAVGDIDGDGSLDIVVGNAGNNDTGEQNIIYLNDRHANFLSANRRLLGSGKDETSSVAVGDVNGDGSLDIVVGNILQQSAIYLNDGVGNFSSALSRSFGNASDWIETVALGDVDNDGHLDIIAGNYKQQNMVYLNDGAGNFPLTKGRMFGTGSDGTGSVAVGDINGDGHLDIITGNYNQQNMVYLNDGKGNFPTTNQLTFGTGVDLTNHVAIGDVNDDGIPDIAVGNAVQQSMVYLSGPFKKVQLPNNPPTIDVTRPGPTRNADFYSTPVTLNSRTIPISYTLRDPEGDPVRQVRAEYSLNGGGNWRPAIAASGTITTNLSTSTTGIQHTFTWDTFASGFFGQSDNVVIRMVAYPSLKSGVNGVPLFQRPYASAMTFPFRVRGTQVRVVNTGGQGTANSIVYRLPTDSTQPRGLIAPSPGQPASTTDQYGYLQGRGALAPGDSLVALSPVPDNQIPPAMIPFTDTVDLYATNISFVQGSNGLQFQGTPVQATGVQTLTTSLNHPLALVNLVVSLEWDARSDERFMTQLRYNLNRASELLFDATNGQMAFGQVHVFFNKENWDNAHIRIYASNRVRPNAVIGGVATTPFTTTYTVDGQSHVVSYGAGQVLIGATWNRFGNAGINIADDWSRVLIHELGHYLFFLDDHYIGRSGNSLVPVPYAACPGIMSDPYASIEFHPQQGWLDPQRNPNCSITLSQRETGESDWQTIARHYPSFHAPSGVFGALDSQGPVQLEVPFTELYEYAPLTPTLTLASPVFATVDAAGNRLELGVRSRAYLFQDDSSDADTIPNNRIVPLGRTTLDQTFARGARVGDRLCIFAERQQWVGCEPITAGDEQITMTQWGTNGRPAWQPDLRLTPVTSTTLQVQIGNVESGQTLMAAIYPVENPQPDLVWPTPIRLTETAGLYSGTFNLPALLSTGLVHVWVEGETPRRETVISFGMEGNAGSGARSTGGGGARSTGGSGARSTGGGGARSTGGSGARSTGGGGARSTGGGFIRTGNAAVATSEGDVLFADPSLTFGVGQFLLLQQVATPPPSPAGTTFVGTSYRFTVPATNAPVIGPAAAVSFSYLGAEVPAGESAGIRVYYYNPQISNPQWVELPTQLNTAVNLAATTYQGPGIYALMSSLRSQLIPGWNAFGYPVQLSQPASDTFASISGQYNTVYTYDPSDTADPWKLYSPDVPGWVNDLGCMQFSHSYWVHTTASTTATLRLRSTYEAGETNPCTTTATAMAIRTAAPAEVLVGASLPATYYGVVKNRAVAGQPVVASIGGQVCGQGVTRLVGGQVVYTINIRAVTGAELACGLPGRLAHFTIGGIPAGSASWNNDAVQQLDLDLDGMYRIFLSLVVR